MTTSSKNLFHLGVRKTSTFNLLYEAALLKETGGVSHPAKKTGKSPAVKKVGDMSTNQIQQKEMPDSSYKWTWGESLSKDDVIALRRPGTKPGRVAHSGYDISLADGRMEGEYSDGPSKNFSTNIPNEKVPEEALFIPPCTDLQLPDYFSRRERHNPLLAISSSNECASPEVVPADHEPGPSEIGRAHV